MVLNEPDEGGGGAGGYSCLGLPQYSLADLQRAMDASDAEMAILQRLGESSLQMKQDDEWGETFIMDLDNQQPVAAAAVAASATAAPPATSTPPPPPLLANRAALLTGDALLMEEHSGKEVVCPSCGEHYLGFPALHAHMTTVHTDSPHQPAGGNKFCRGRRGSMSVHKQDLLGLKRSGVEPRCVCLECRMILPRGAMGDHLTGDHSLPKALVDSCPPADPEEGGERLKSKMSSALGDLLDRAVNNLIAAKRSGSPHQLSCGAVQLLTKLCAVRRKDSIHRNRLKEESESGDERKSSASSGLYPCPICQQRFTLASMRNRHMLSCQAKNPPAQVDHSEALEYENDWREAPSPPPSQTAANGETPPHSVQPLCLDCGLGFSSLAELSAHRADLHAARPPPPPPPPKPVVAAAVVGRGVGRRKREGGGGGGDGGGGGGTKRGTARKTNLKKVRLTHIGEESVREKAEAALRELNLPRKSKEGSARWAQSMTFTSARPPPSLPAAGASPLQQDDTYAFTD